MNNNVNNAIAVLTTAFKSNCQREVVMLSIGSSITINSLGQSKVFILDSGMVSVRRLSDKKVLTTLSSPSIIGLSCISGNIPAVYIHAESNSTLSSFFIDDINLVLNKMNLWVYVSIILCDFFSILYKRDEMLRSASVYGVIKEHLEFLWGAQGMKCECVSIYDFILSRTSISRSSLSKILKELEFGGYIKTSRGRLINMNKLPKSF